MTSVNVEQLLTMVDPDRTTKPRERESTPVPPVGSDFGMPPGADVPSRAAPPTGDATEKATTTTSTKPGKARRLREIDEEERTTHPTKVRKTVPGRPDPYVKQSPLAAASVGAQNRSRRLLESFQREATNALHYPPKHTRPPVPVPGTVSSLIQSELERAARAGANHRGEDGMGPGAPAGANTRRAKPMGTPSELPPKGQRRVVDPEAAMINREFQETVSKALVRSGGKILRLPDEETQSSTGLHKLVERNLRWFDEAHDGFKLIGLLAAKKLNALAEETINRFLPTTTLNRHSAYSNTLTTISKCGSEFTK